MVLSLKRQQNVEKIWIHEVPFRLFITGDMAVYAMMLGKEGSDIYWCIW
jgi:hypothetical protein